MYYNSYVHALSFLAKVTLTGPFLIIMLLERRYLYHPFVDSNFGFLAETKGSSEEEAINEGFVVEKIDLYYQPVQEPTIGIAFYLLRIILIGIGEFILLKIWKMLNEENGLVKEVTKLYTITMMVACPFWSLFNASVDFIHPMQEVVGKWYCTIGHAVMFFSANIISFHSFFVASMRYLFIVHGEKVNIYGRDRIRRIFLLLYFCLALIVVLWGFAEGAELDAMSFINKCYGKDHKVFLIDKSSLNVAKRNFCEHEDYNYNGSLTDWMISLIRRLSCISKVLIMLLMGFNVFEGFLYFKTLSHIYR